MQVKIKTGYQFSLWEFFPKLNYVKKHRAGRKHRVTGNWLVLKVNHSEWKMECMRYEEKTYVFTENVLWA